MQTLGSITVWVANLAYAKNVCIDVRVFGGDDERIHAETFTLPYAGSGEGGGDLLFLDRRVYAGSVASPGSVSPRAAARTVQYHVYYGVVGQLFTDGILHRQSLTADAITL